MIEKNFESVTKSKDKSEPQKEKMPEISFHVFSSFHATSEDYKKLERAFKKADIYIPESILWTPEGIEFLQDVSDGKINPNTFDQSSYIHKMIYNTKKPILLADIPRSDELKALFELDNEIFEHGLGLFEQGKFQRSIKKLRLFVKRDAMHQLQREEKIKQNVKNELNSFLSTHPKYLNKKQINVLLSPGGLHTKFYHDLKKHGTNISREFSESPFTPPSITEATRRSMFGKKITDELLAKSIMEDLLYPYLKESSNNSAKIVQAIRKISKRLTLKDIKQISKNVAKKSDQDINLIFIKELEKLNIKIPKSEQEIDALLKEKF